MPVVTHSPIAAPRHDVAPQQPRGDRPDRLHRLQLAVDAVTGIDMQLIYGLAVPMLFIIGLIIWLVLAPSYWIVGATLVLELGCLGMIINKVLGMLAEEEQAESR